VRWGFISTKREWERRKRQRWVVAFKCVILFLPPPLLFIGPDTNVTTPWAPPGKGLRANQEVPRERPRWTDARSVRPTCGVGWPHGGAPHLVLCRGGCRVGPYGDSRCPRGFEVVWARWWAIGSMWCTHGGFWFVGSSSLGLMTSWIQGMLAWQLLIG
jgi:hypothetical protein